MPVFGNEPRQLPEPRPREPANVLGSTVRGRESRKPQASTECASVLSSVVRHQSLMGTVGYGTARTCTPDR